MAPSARRKVIGIGVACLDMLIAWRDMAAPVLGNEIAGFDTQGGGMAATAMVAVARLGGRAEYWGAVGDDWAAQRILADLAAEHVDTSQVRRIDGGRGPLMFVCIDRPTGERHFFRWTGLCASDRPVGSLDRLADAGCLLTDCTRPEIDVAATREARRLGVAVVADVGGVGRHTPDVLPFVDYAIASEDYARSVGLGNDLRQACERLRAMGPRHVVVTLGDRGLVYLVGEEFGRLDAFPVEVVDTTGAGDVFHGAFCQGLVQGLPMKTNLVFASAVAAMKCRHMGGRAGIPTRDELCAFLKERGVSIRDG